MSFFIISFLFVNEVSFMLFYLGFCLGCGFCGQMIP